MFGPKIGTWRGMCKSDPRWNKSGRGEGLITSGGPKEMWNWIEQCKEKYGEPPNDAQMSFVKD
jgi:hypothetical protein